MTWRIFLGLVIALGVALGATWLPAGSELTKPTRGPVLPVAVSRLKLRDGYTVRRIFSGTVKPRRESTLSFQRVGPIIEFCADQGDQVPANQPLATIDLRHLDSRRDEINAQIHAAQAQLEELEAGPRPEEIARQRAIVADLQAQLARLQSENARQQKLISHKAISDAEYDETRYGLASARARLEAAESQLAELLAGTRPEQLTAQRAVVTQLKAQLATLDVEREDSTLRAPFAGWITRRFLDEGEVVSAGQPVFQMIEEAPWEAWIGVPPDSLQSLKLGDCLDVQINGQAYASTVRAKLQQLDVTTRTQTLVMELSPESGLSIPGQLVRLEVDDHVEQPGYWLPLASLTRDTRGLWSVFVAEPEQDAHAHVSRRLVEVLHMDGDRAFVRGAISETDEVIASGVQRLAVGQWVQPQRSLETRP